jgi:hypothetical protein
LLEKLSDERERRRYDKEEAYVGEKTMLIHTNDHDYNAKKKRVVGWRIRG